jgi:hypothetical protein
MAIDCRTAGKDLARQLAWSGRGDAESFVDARAQVLASAEFWAQHDILRRRECGAHFGRELRKHPRIMRKVEEQPTDGGSRCIGPSEVKETGFGEQVIGVCVRTLPVSRSLAARRK